jgi:hypothetical protein
MITLSSSERFIVSGLVLFGPRWKAPLARTLGVTRETVSRWVSDKNVPPWARNTVTLLVRSKGSVLSLFDKTTNMVQPWADAGFECFCVDAQHPSGEHRQGNITTIGADIRTWLRPLFIHHLPPSKDRANLRSETPRGFARAIFEANVGRNMMSASCIAQRVVPRGLLILLNHGGIGNFARNPTVHMGIFHFHGQAGSAARTIS